MFQPPIFREERLPVMQGLMASHPLATLVTSQNDQLTADHVPLVLHPELSDKGTLRGHLARVNPIVSSGHKKADALVVFQGPQAYISPSWYASKLEHGKVVPTWNYAVVHARGSLTLIDDGEWLMNHLEALTDRHESHRKVPWEVKDAPADYIARQIKGIVGIEMTIESLDGTWKLSQNKHSKDRSGVIAGLQGDEASADAAQAMSELIDHS